jgi:hypothetical protein
VTWTKKRLGLVFLVLSVGFVCWYLLRPNPLPRAAAKTLDALMSGDGDALYAATGSYERECSHLTPEKLHKAWQILLEPAIRSSKFLRKDEPELVSNQVQAHAFAYYLDKQGNPWSMVAIVNQSDEGPKSGVVFKMLSTASLFSGDGLVHPSLDHDLSVGGVDRYRKQLEDIGIDRVMLAPGRSFTWDELRAKM